MAFIFHQFWLMAILMASSTATFCWTPSSQPLTRTTKLGISYFNRMGHPATLPRQLNHSWMRNWDPGGSGERTCGLSLAKPYPQNEDASRAGCLCSVFPKCGVSKSCCYVCMGDNLREHPGVSLLCLPDTTQHMCGRWIFFK